MLQCMWNSIHVYQQWELELKVGVSGAPAGPPASNAHAGRVATAAAADEEPAIDLGSRRRGVEAGAARHRGEEKREASGLAPQGAAEGARRCCQGA